MADERVRRLALNEAVVREVNEAVESIAAEWFADEEAIEFRCECIDLTCDARISLLRTQYEWVRASPVRFVVMPGHEDPEIERVVRDLDGARVVEKIGPGHEVAEETSPR